MKFSTFTPATARPAPLLDEHRSALALEIVADHHHSTPSKREDFLEREQR
jgi:hypothetical protein